MAVVGASARPGLVRRADGDRGAAQPGRRAACTWSTRHGHGPRPPVRPVARRRPRARSTWCCSACPTPPWLEQVALAAARGDARRGDLRAGARRSARAGWPRPTGWMALCGGGCMGFVNVAARRPRHRLPRARPAAPRADRAGHPLRVGVLRAAAHPPRLGVHPGRLLRPGARHHGRRLPRLRAGAAGDPRDRPVPRDDARRRRRCAPGSPSAAERDIPVVALTVGGVAARPRDGRRPLRRARRRRRGWEALFAAYGVHRVDDLGELVDTPRAVRDRPAARRRRAAASRPCTTPAPSGRCVADVADGSACRSRRWPTATTDAAGRRARPRARRRPTRSTSGAAAPTPRTCSAECLAALADDPAVDAVALAVDLVAGVRRRRGVPDAMRPAARRGPTSRSSCWPTRLGRRPAAGRPACARSASPCSRAPVRAARAAHLLATAPPRAAAAAPSTRRGGPAGSAGSRPARRRRLAARCWPTTAIPVVAPRCRVRRGTRPSAPPGVRLPGGAQDRRAGVAPQARRRTASGSGSATPTPSARRTTTWRPARPGWMVQPQVAAGVEVALGLVRDPLLGPLVAGRRRRHARRAARRARGRAAAGRRRRSRGRHGRAGCACRRCSRADRGRPAVATRRGSSRAVVGVGPVVAHELGDASRPST